MAGIIALVLSCYYQENGRPRAALIWFLLALLMWDYRQSAENIAWVASILP